MNNFVGYKCTLCGKEYAPEEVTYTCPADGGNLDVVLDYEAIKAKYQPDDITCRTETSLWRYLPLKFDPLYSPFPLKKIYTDLGSPVLRLNLTTISFWPVSRQ